MLRSIRAALSSSAALRADHCELWHPELWLQLRPALSGAVSQLRSLCLTGAVLLFLLLLLQTRSHSDQRAHTHTHSAAKQRGQQAVSIQRRHLSLVQCPAMQAGGEESDYDALGGDVDSGWSGADTPRDDTTDSPASAHQQQQQPQQQPRSLSPQRPLHPARPGAAAAAVAASDDLLGDDDSSDDAIHGSNVRVVVRVRPLLGIETSSVAHTCALMQIGGEVIRPGGSTEEQQRCDAAGISVQAKDAVHQFSFDAVLTPQHTQADVYEAGKVDRMLQALLKGSDNACSGSGADSKAKSQLRQQCTANLTVSLCCVALRVYVRTRSYHGTIFGQLDARSQSTERRRVFILALVLTWMSCFSSFVLFPCAQPTAKPEAARSDTLGNATHHDSID